MTLSAFNTLNKIQLKEALEKCCGASNWVMKMASKVPYENEAALFENAALVWRKGGQNDWLEAFQHHPKIGDINSLKEKFSNTKAWASGEQSGLQKASDETIMRLSKGNALYEEKFGFIFIVCASGKSAEEMLEMLETRLSNDRETEILIAMQEQEKITNIRLKKLLSE